MRTHQDAKAMAKTLREELQARNHAITHGECLDIVAKQFGLKDWNVLAAKMEATIPGSSDTELVVPDGWVTFGTAPHLYRMGVPRTGGFMTLERVIGTPPDQGNIYGSLAQAVSPARYRGRFVRISAEVRTEAVEGSAAIWLRIDDAVGKILSFSDLQRARFGALRGSVDWTRQTIALPVPDDAHSIHFGVYLHGFGRAYARDFALVATDAPDLGLDGLPDAPVNLALQAA
jgi:hypothetical protein